MYVQARTTKNSSSYQIIVSKSEIVEIEPNASSGSIQVLKHHFVVKRGHAGWVKIDFLKKTYSPYVTFLFCLRLLCIRKFFRSICKQFETDRSLHSKKDFLTVSQSNFQNPSEIHRFYWGILSTLRSE